MAKIKSRRGIFPPNCPAYWHWQSLIGFCDDGDGGGDDRYLTRLTTRPRWHLARPRSQA